MPVQQCTSDGKSGYRWGEKGKCYTGPGAKKKAIKQGIKIEGPKKFAAKAAGGEEITKNDMYDLVLDPESTVSELSAVARAVKLTPAELIAVDFTRKRIFDGKDS
jgi:hypothetical protein